LERLLGAIDKTIQASTTVVQMVYEEIVSQGKLNLARHEMAIKMLGKMRVELATLTDHLRTLVQGHGIQISASIEARDALMRTGEKLERVTKEVTGKFETMRAEDEEGDAPRSVRVFAVQLTNFLWPTAVRTGKGALLYGIKLLSGFGTLGGLMKIIHDMVVGG
jgi:hypothetical protein